MLWHWSGLHSSHKICSRKTHPHSEEPQELLEETLPNLIIINFARDIENYWYIFILSVLYSFSCLTKSSTNYLLSLHQLCWCSIRKITPSCGWREPGKRVWILFLCNDCSFLTKCYILFIARILFPYQVRVSENIAS